MGDRRRDNRDENYVYDEEAEMREWKEWAERWVDAAGGGGAGEEGTDELVRKYKRDTPGQ